jgi:hypothetical protein
MSTLKQLFDGQVELREADGGGSEIRVRGAGTETDWKPMS